MCRHCNDKAALKKKRVSEVVKYRQVTKAEAYELVFGVLLEGVQSGVFNTQRFFSAESIAKYFSIQKHMVVNALRVMNQRGLVSQKYNRPPHDSTRDRWGGDSSWMPSQYNVNVEKFNALLKR